MMVRLIGITGISLVLSATAYSQILDKALIRVRYSFSHLRDTTQRDKLYRENMLLVAGRNASVYTSYDQVNQKINLSKSIQEQIKNNAGGPQRIKVENRMDRPLTNEDLYFLAAENKMITKEHLFNNYLVEEPADKIAWKILKDTATFSGVHCQKASARFKGRDWIAWFAPEMPFQSGPWKLNGLPGLIIEAYDEKKEVMFLFAGMENVTAENATSGTVNDGTEADLRMPGIDMETYLGAEIKLPNDAIRTTRKQLERLKEAKEKDPQGFMNTQMAASGSKGSFRISPPKGNGSLNEGKKTEINNPIELSE